MVRLTVHHRKRLLLAANAVLGLAIVACVSAGVFWPLGVGQSDTTPTRQDQATSRPVGPIEPLGSYAVIYDKDIRGPLYDPAPASVVAIKPAVPKLTVQLVGTVLEPGFTYGLFRTAGGKTRLVLVGQTVAGAEVVSVRDGSATVKFAGKIHQLAVKRKEPK